MVLLLVYDNAFPMEAALRILERNPLKCSLGLYLDRGPKLDETGKPQSPSITADEIRDYFGLTSIYRVNGNEFRKINEFAADIEPFLGLSELISKSLLAGEKGSQIAYFVSREPDTFLLIDFVTRLYNVLGIGTRNLIAYSSEMETGIVSDGLLPLLPSPAYGDLREDPDSVCITFFFELLGRIMVSEQNLKGKSTENFADYPLTMSKVATIIQPFLPPLRGPHRGFQGTYKRLTQRAERLVEEGILTVLVRDRLRFYSITPFGRVVSRVLQDPNVLHLMEEPVTNAFLDKEGNPRISELIKLIRKSLTLGWIKP